MVINRLIEQPTTIQIPHPSYEGINRLLAAAIVNHQFCTVLLNDPARAIQDGFEGEPFNLSTTECELIIAIRSSSLTDFAEQLCKALPTSCTPVESSLANYTSIRGWPM